MAGRRRRRRRPSRLARPADPLAQGEHPLGLPVRPDGARRRPAVADLRRRDPPGRGLAAQHGHPQAAGRGDGPHPRPGRIRRADRALPGQPGGGIHHPGRAAPDRRDHGGQRRCGRRHHHRRLPGAARRRRRRVHHRPPQEPILLSAAARTGRVRYHRRADGAGVGRSSPTRCRAAGRPLRHRLPPGPRSAGRLPAGTPGRHRPCQPDPAGRHPRATVLARPGAPPSRDRLAAPGPRGRRGMEATHRRQDHPPPRNQRRRRRRRRRRRGGGTQPPAQRHQLSIHGAGVLPGHRPVGDRRSGAVGTVGGPLPDQGRGDPAPQTGRPPQVPHGSTDPRTAARAARADRRGGPPTHRGRATAHRRAGHPARREVHCRRPNPASGGHHPGPGQHLGREPHRPRRRRPPQPHPRGGPGVLGLGGRAGPAADRDSGRGTDRADPPQPGAIPATGHR